LPLIKVSMKNRSFTLIESVVAIFLLTVGTVGAFSLIQRTLAFTATSSSRLVAAYLAQEGIELVRNIRDSNYLAKIDWNSGLTACASGCEMDYNDTVLSSFAGRFLKIDGGFYNYDSGTNTIFKRKITIASPGGVPSSGTLDLRVGASSDDCRGYDHPTHSNFSLTTTYLTLGYQVCMGLRFLNVTVPQGATIDTAYLTLKSTDSQSGAIDSYYIYGNDVDDAATFSNVTDFNGRALTDAKVLWEPNSWTKDNNYNSPEIKTVIQEIVNRASWTSGNDLAIIIHHEGTSSRYRHAYSYNGSATYAPELHIEYTAEGPPGPETDSLEVTVEVSWTERGINRQLTAQTELYDWR
jgi:type II secretory pathway pseudopilin PulG